MTEASKTFFQNIITALKDKKKISDASIIVYIRNLKKLNGDKAFTDFKFLDEPEEIMKKLSEYKETTKRNYLVSIVSVLSVFPELKELHDKYYTLMMGKKAELEAADDGKMTDTQSDNWMTWEQVKDIYTQLEQKVGTFYKQKNLSDEQYGEILSYALLSLYINQQPRRNKDYQLMRVVDAFTTELDPKFNYLDMSKKKFIFNVYKTSKKYGRFDMPINKVLFASLKKYFKHRQNKLSLDDLNDKPLLIRYDGKALDKSNDITKLLNKVFGKKIGSSMLRHIFLTDKYDAIIDEQKKDAGTMAHSPSEQKKYVLKPLTVTFD
jgi:hypothetical protein